MRPPLVSRMTTWLCLARFVGSAHASALPTLDADAFKRFVAGAFAGTPAHYFHDPVGRKIEPIADEDVESFLDAFNNSAHAIQPPKTATPVTKP
ncbi:MAG: hypothetical protein IV085_03530 [Thiobacillus sp.]|nr:hypothetical protein [Thiobacillus sp.]